MMETYAERLQKRKEQKMSNYDLDEIERLRERERMSREIRPVELGKDEKPWTAVDIELRDEDFTMIALEAHERDITFNKMINIILKDGIKQAQYRLEHQSKPQLLNDDK